MGNDIPHKLQTSKTTRSVKKRILCILLMLALHEVGVAVILPERVSKKSVSLCALSQVTAFDSLIFSKGYNSAVINHLCESQPLLMRRKAIDISKEILSSLIVNYSKAPVSESVAGLLSYFATIRPASVSSASNSFSRIGTISSASSLLSNKR